MRISYSPETSEAQNDFFRDPRHLGSQSQDFRVKKNQSHFSKPPENVDRGLIGNRTGNSFERKFSLLMHVDACKAQKEVEKNVSVYFLGSSIPGHPHTEISYPTSKVTNLAE